MLEQRPWYSRLLKRGGYCMSASFNILPTQCIYTICIHVYLATKSEFRPMQQSMISFWLR
jgi:hypothetical protein